ncbi:MAG: hypothetical protein LBM70_06180 [Victivallales bacterium]|jgi:hypothetical protein|nr:hypothetical protein [Victivallales bacterium]
MKHWFLAVLLCIVAPSLSAETVANPVTDGGRIYFKDKKNKTAGNFPLASLPRIDGENPGVRIDCAQGEDIAYFEWGLPRAKVLPEFLKAEFQIDMLLPENHPGRTVNLRLIDAHGETFQFRTSLPKAGDGKWHEFTLTVDAENPRFAARWGGGEKADKKLTMPIKLIGITVDLKAGSGELGLGLISCRVIDSNAPCEVKLLTGTGSPIHVLKPEDAGQLALCVINPRPKPLKGTLRWEMSGVRGENLGDANVELDLAIAEKKELKLPVPTLFGVYRIAISVKDSDPAVRFLDKKLSFAYMVPANTLNIKKDGFIFGVCSHPQRHNAESQKLEAMAASYCGATAVRDDVEWQRVQPREGVWNFDSFDRVVSTFGKYGVEVLPILSYGVAWATAKDWKPINPKSYPRSRPDYGHWRTFVSHFAKRYRDKIRYAEVWNEPDLYSFANFPADEYVKMMEIAYEEIKKEAPEWKVLCGGFACLPGQSGKSGNPEVMPAVIRSGAYDIFAFHGHGLFGGYRNQIRRLPSFGNTKPWYANETAVSSMIYGEDVQAGTLFRKLIFSWAEGSIGYNWYDLRNDGFNPKNNEHNFGLVTYDFFPKKAYVAYNMLASLYRGGTFLREVKLEKDLQGYLFLSREGDQLLSAWSDTGDDRVLPLLVSGINGNAEAIDLYGNARKLENFDDAVIFEVGDEPVTLRIAGQKGDIKVTGALVRPLGDIEAIPGGKSVFSFEFSNPADKPRELRLKLTLPLGLSAKNLERKIRIAAKGKAVAEFNVDALPAFRSLPAAPQQLTLKVDGRSFRNKVGSSTIIPAKGYRTEPDFELKDGGLVHPLVPNMPDTAYMFWQGVQDLSSKIYLGRDGDALLLRVEVTDDKHVQPNSDSEVWKGDNIQFALQIPNQKGFWEFGLTRTDAKTSEVFAWNAPVGFDMAKAVAAIRLETARDEDRKLTTYEARIPFGVIGLTSKEFRFNLLVNDNDGFGRESFIRIAPGLGTGKSTELYPKIKF